MSKPAIVVENLSKSYRLGLRERQHQSFRDALTGMVTAPFRRLREFGERGTEEDTFWALKDVNFEVQPGEVVGIIGRNGAGKSTLLKVLSRIVEPTSGRIRLRGRVASLLEVGTGFHPELSGRENIYMNGSILGMRKAEIDRKFDEIVAFAEVEKFLDTPVKRYSSGMYVRLAFAVAAHLEPEILIVDEVLAVGDQEFQRKCLNKMQDVASGSGRTVLFVSHNLGAIRSLCTKGIVLKQGRLIYAADAVSSCAKYLNESQAEVRPAVATYDRPKGAPIWMRRAAIVSSGKEQGALSTGDPLAIAVDVESEDPINRAYLCLTVQSPDGTRLIFTDNRFQGTPTLNQASKQFRITFDLGAVPLMAGDYRISLALGDWAADTHRVEDALRLTIVDRDIWGLGKMAPRTHGQMWWPVDVKLVDSQQEAGRPADRLAKAM